MIINGRRSIGSVVPTVERRGGGDVLDPGDLTRSIKEFIGVDESRTVQGSMLRTVLFTDVVDSTARASAMGDDRWREVVQEHRTQIRQVLGRFGGSEVDTARDGFFAVFEGPTTAVRAATEIGLAGASEVLVSRTVKDLVAGSGLVLEDAGTHQVKGISEPWQLFRVARR